MHVRGTFRVPKVNPARFQRALHKQLSQALVDGAEAYLEAVTPSNRSRGVPVWSGASRATFSQLAGHIPYALDMLPVPGVPNRISLGMAAGEASFDPGTTQTGLYRFVYRTTLPHLLINEYHNANTFLDPEGRPYFRLKNPGPYHFQRKGAEAFGRRVSEIKLPGWGSLCDVATRHVG